jgi:type I restriction enzyme S subunit
MSVPKLRFPEFLDSGEWEEKTLGDLYSFKSTNSFSRDQLNYENGVVRNIHYGDIHTKFSTLFNIKNENVPFVNPSESLEKIKPDCYCVESDIIFADASEDLEDIGKSIEIVHLNNQKLLSGLHTLLARQKNNTFIVGFGGYLFKSNWIRNQIQKESQGTKVLGISATRLSSISIAFPVKTKEQQKIADCLSSIDDRITAETQKLATLKAHKKGLTQQLFPAEGETLPKLRFPEFRDSGEWKKGTIDNLAINTMGNAFKSSDFVENGIQLVRMGNLYQGELQLNRMPVYLPTIFGKEHSNFLVKPLDLLMSMTGTVGKKDYGFIVQVPKKCKPLLLNQRVIKIEPKKNCIKEFLLQMLKNDSLLNKLYSSAGGTKQANLSAQQLKDLNITFPQQPEQQKIADFLTSIDDLIAAQTQKIATLKTHKKGLMQQLFPSV